jgi:hypothetical protein
MRTHVQQDDLVVFTAEAIVQAEWLRLQLDERAWHGEDSPAGEDAPRMLLSRGFFGTGAIYRPAAMPTRPDGLRPLSANPPQHHVWATQRSPP